MGGLVLLGGGMLPQNAAQGLAATAVLAVRTTLLRASRSRWTSSSMMTCRRACCDGYM